MRFAGAIFLALVPALATPDQCYLPCRGPLACGPGWNATCLVATILGIARCGHRASTTSLGQCMNLAPSGSGTRTLFHALLPHSKLARHDHLRTIERVAAERNDNASCFIITLREPVERIEAGFHDTHGGPCVVNDIVKSCRIDDVATNWTLKARTKPCHQREDFLGRTRRESGSTTVFSMPTMYYLLGNECATGRHEIHSLCTRTLTDDLSALFSRFGAQNAEVVSVFSQFGNITKLTQARSSDLTQAQLSVLNRTTIHDQALRDWVNYVMFPADTALYQTLCTGSRDGRDAGRVGRIVDAVSRRGAELVARNLATMDNVT